MRKWVIEGGCMHYSPGGEVYHKRIEDVPSIVYIHKGYITGSEAVATCAANFTGRLARTDGDPGNRFRLRELIVERSLQFINPPLVPLFQRVIITWDKKKRRVSIINSPVI